MANKYAGVSQTDGGSWKYRVKIKMPDGTTVNTERKRDENGMPFLTARAAYEAKKSYESKLKAEAEGIVVKYKDATLEKIYEHYLTTEGKTKMPATIRKQDSMWRNHIKDRWGKRNINTITIIELNDFLFSLYQKYSYKYTEGFLKFLYLLWGIADRMEVIDPIRYNKLFVSRNSRLKMPEMTQEDFQDSEEGAVIYNDEQLAVLERIFRSEDGNLQPAFYLGLYCGLRISECFALRWSNVNWRKRTITIDRQMHYEDGILKLCPVKTLTSVREVLLTNFILNYLRNLYDTRKAEESKLGYRNTEKVYDTISKEWITGGDFVNRKKNGELLTVNSMKYWSKKVKAETKGKLEFKYHNLRHTFASTCAFNNVNLQMLMRMMGHKKIETTMKYYIGTDNEPLRQRTLDIMNNMYDYVELFPSNADVTPLF